MAELKAADKLAKGAKEPGSKRGTTRVSEKPTLAEQGIDKNLANNARMANPFRACAGVCGGHVAAWLHLYPAPDSRHAGDGGWGNR